MVKVLLDAGAEVNIADSRQTTPLMLAAASGGADAIKLLLDHEADVNAKEAARGQTALMFAAALNRGAAIKVLMARGADPGVASRVVKLGCGSQFGHDGCAAVDENGDPLPEEQTPAAAKTRANAKGESAQPKDAMPDQAALNASAVAMGLKSAVYLSDGSGTGSGSPELKQLRLGGANLGYESR